MQRLLNPRKSQFFHHEKERLQECVSMTSEEKSFAQPAIPKFDGHYEHWAMLIENLLRSKEYSSLIENGIPTLPVGATQEQIKVVEDAKLKDLKVKNYLFQTIARGIIETILKKETGKDTWESLKMKYQGTGKVRRAQLQALRREFEILGMKQEGCSQLLRKNPCRCTQNESSRRNYGIDNCCRENTSLNDSKIQLRCVLY